MKQVIAVSSGKGGVGKSTVAVNLACALAEAGLRVGLLDADIYGPNAPTMLGVADRTPEVQGEGADQRLTPIESCGIAMVSMGLLIGENQPVIWRGPMLTATTSSACCFVFTRRASSIAICSRQQAAGSCRPTFFLSPSFASSASCCCRSASRY